MIVRIQLPVREIYLDLTNHPSQLSLAIPPLVGSMSMVLVKQELCSSPGNKAVDIARAYIEVRGNHFIATGNHMQHGNTQCYLPSGYSDFPAVSPAKGGI